MAASLTHGQVAAVLRTLGFVETERAGDRFYWYEFPPPSWERNHVRDHRHGRWPVARVQFYVPRGDFGGWLYIPGQPHRDVGARVDEYVFYEQNVRTLGQRLLQEQVFWIAEASTARPPVELLRVARESWSGALVLRDWLLERGLWF